MLCPDGLYASTFEPLHLFESNIKDAKEAERIVPSLSTHAETYKGRSEQGDSNRPAVG